MTQSSVSTTATPIFSPELDKSICESLGCNNKTTVKREVSAGKFGMIVLNLCTDCAIKFE